MKRQQSVQKNKIALTKYLNSSIATIPVMGIAMLFYSCSNDIETIKAFSSDEERPALTAENFEMIFSDSTIIRYKMQTPELIRFDEENDPFMEFPQGVYIEQFDNKMQVISSLSANYARYYEKEERWEVKNNVVAVNAQNDTLKTEELIQDQKNGRVYSEQFVKIIRKDQIITGIGFESDQEMSDWKVKKPRGTLYVDVEE